MLCQRLTISESVSTTTPSEVRPSATASVGRLPKTLSTLFFLLISNATSATRPVIQVPNDTLVVVAFDEQQFFWDFARCSHLCELPNFDALFSSNLQHPFGVFDCTHAAVLIVGFQPDRKAL